MPCTGKTLTLPNISCLDFKLDWDISGATPSVKITNNSTIVDATKLKWWFFITSPSGVSVFGVDVNTVTPPTPTVNQIAWTAKTIVLPTPFNPGQCGQIEFSPSAPYSVTVFVQDITAVANPIDGYTKTTIIVRPNGNTSNSCGNFGTAAANVKVDCTNRNIMCFDGTKMIYNNILTPLTTSRKWTLVYPADEQGDIPNMTSTEANVNFPASTNSQGYMIYFQLYATYDYGNGITVKVQYKLFSKNGELGEKFAVNCNTNLCLLQCQMKKFYDLSVNDCGAVENAALTQRMIRLQWMFSQILTGIFQPLCGIDVPGLIEEMKQQMGFTDGCDCGCDESNTNFGFSNPISGGSSSSTCCPVMVNVLDINTNNAPASCPSSYFPAAIYSPDGTTIIGVATDADTMVAIINGNASWQVYGTAFNMGNCQVGFYKNPGITSVPPVFVSIGMTVNILDVLTGLPPASCPGAYFPVTVYQPDGTTVLGTAGSISALIALVNSSTLWQAYGTAYYNGTNCTVAFIPQNGVSSVPPIKVAATTGCVNGIQHYTVVVEDICSLSTPPVTSSSFPLTAWVDFGSGLVSLGTIANSAGFVTALNAASTKPASVTFTAGPDPSILNYDVNNTNCGAYSTVIHIYTDVNSGAYLLSGANHKTIATPQPNSGGIYGVGVRTMALLGKIAGLATNEFWWHVTMVENRYLLATNAHAGKVYCFDMTNPLMPSLVGIATLNDTGSGQCFQGTPQEFGVPMYYGLYFPTDVHSMTIREVLVMESSTGSMWQVSFAGTPVVSKSVADQRLKGACPRIHYKGVVWFTQDGDYRNITGPGAFIGVSEVFDTAGTWSGSNLSEVTIFPNQVEQVWAASMDQSTGIAYFAGHLGSIATVDLNTASLINRYSNVMGQSPTKRLNVKFWLNKLYHSTYGGYTTPGGLSTGTRYIDTTTLGAANTIVNFQPFLSNNVTHWNFMPLKCFGVLTYENGTSGAGFALFTLDGNFLGNIPFTSGAAYNVVYFPGILAYTPNSLV